MRWSEVLRKSLGGGIPGAVAMVLQVLCLMWLRTTVNYQMVTGLSFVVALDQLYRAGGIARFYRGVGPALLQGPLSRFGDTASNAGILALLEKSRLPVFAQTMCASLVAALWRVVITPIDTVKTVMQVEGSSAAVWRRYRDLGIAGFYAGAFGTVAATFLGHYPWFLTNNFLEKKLPTATSRVKVLLRRALIGFASSFCADCCANSIRVLKTVTQTSAVPIGYVGALALVLKQDGVYGLMFRGLAAKIVANGLQSILFSLLWKMMMDKANIQSSASAGTGYPRKHPRNKE
ncbi:hypothetical protein CTAYLR_008756 [Chrysophaeum taylorii]|uniref:Mitochondrial carrier protein n=1 Tax=Chrysophaeum taylorii TaxID=2483200 RepID=A0AAD7UDJ6_9STRA|nr:hypothetical protein CTAYLR_008756 [Chrysophaeum taylorii]